MTTFAYIATLIVAQVGGPYGGGHTITEVCSPAGCSFVGSVGLNDDTQLQFGNAADFVCEYDTSVTPDAMVCGIGTDSRVWYFTEVADVGTDWGKAQQANPTLCVQSADETSTTDRLCLTHDQTDAILSSDAGDINLVPAGGDVNVTGDVEVSATVTANSVTDGSATMTGGTVTATTLTDSTLSISGADISTSSGDITVTPAGGDMVVSGDIDADDMTTDVGRVATEPYIQSRGTNLVTNGNGFLRDSTNWTGIYSNHSLTFDPTISNGSPGAFKTDSASSTRTIYTDEVMPVSPNNAYEMRFSIIKVDGSDKPVYAGIVAADYDGLEIQARHHMFLSGTQTTLAAPLTPGDSTITLTDSTNWYLGGLWYRRCFILWGYKNSGGYAYPAGTYSRYTANGNGYTSGTGGAWAQTTGISGNVITLTVNFPAALGNPDHGSGTWPIGTPISNASSGGAYKYIAALAETVTDSWQDFRGTISGIDLSGTNVNDQFPPGTAGVRGLFLLSFGSGSTATQAITNVEFSNLNIPNLRNLNGDFVLSHDDGGKVVITNDSENDAGPLCLGGETSAYPALVRDGTTISMELCDGSLNTDIEATYYSTATVNPATTGVVRVANTECIAGRNFGNDGNETMCVNASDEFEFSGPVVSTGLVTGQGGLDAGDANVTNVADLDVDTITPDGASWTGDDCASLTSAAATPAASGVLRLGNTESIGWRDNGNTTDVTLSVNASDQIELSAMYVLTDTVWDDLRFPALRLATPASEAPTLTQIQDDGGTSKGVYTYCFGAAGSDYLLGTAQLPHSYKPATNIEPHIHYVVQDTNTGDVRWNIEYTTSCAGSGTIGTTTISGATSAVSGTALDEIMVDLGQISGTGLSESCNIMFNIEREGDHLDDDYAGVACLIEADFHIEKNKLGTDNETP